VCVLCITRKKDEQKIFLCNDYMGTSILVYNYTKQINVETSPFPKPF
jgi:hypothetical protein